MSEHADIQLQLKDTVWLTAARPLWKISGSTLSLAERKGEEVIPITRSPEEQLFSLSNLSSLNKGKLDEELRRKPAEHQGPPPLPWERQHETTQELPVSDDDIYETELIEDSEALDLLVRRATQELPSISAEQEEIILASGSWQTNMAITSRVESHWHLEAALMALGGSLAAVLSTLVVLI